VVRGDDPCSIVVTPGVALDGWGREILVPTESSSVPIPAGLVDRVCGRDEPCDDEEPVVTKGGSDSGDEPEEQRPSNPEQRQPPERHGDHDDERERKDACVTVVLCYHECESDPVAVLAGDCATSAPCAPGSIREQYRIAFEPGCTDPVEVSCRFPDILTRGEIEYGALARWVTQECPAPPENPCIPLANLRLDCRGGGCNIDEIDIEIRPIVFGNDIVFDTLTRIVDEGRPGDERRRRR
jgi:hypothetical protein